MQSSIFSPQVASRLKGRYLYYYRLVSQLAK